MNIHEYQAKALLKRLGAPVAEGYPAISVEEAIDAANRLPGPTIVVKSQIHAGGRGKGHFAHSGAGCGGGVRIAGSVDEAVAAARAMLGNTLITHQTSSSGKTVHCVYLEQGATITNEVYLSMLVDRQEGKIALVASPEGGMDIEEVAARTPERIHTLHIDTATGITDELVQSLSMCLGLSGQAQKECHDLTSILYKAFTSTDMSLLEINPLIVDGDGHLQVMDAKMSFDGNALFRHPDIACLRDQNEEDQREQEGAQWDLAYIALDGNIGCMVNGAGLAMATMDIIKLHGASPANFCDVGGGASREKVAAAFKIILKDENVQGILVNIFGGIMKCDVIADGVLQAVRETNLSVPLVVRLEGTNVDQGKATIAASGLNVIPADDLDDAARKIVDAIAA